MTEVVDNGAMDLENEAEANVASETVEAEEATVAEGADMPSGDSEGDSADAVSKSPRSYRIGYDETKMRQLIASVDYLNTGRPGSPFDEDFTEWLLDHPEVKLMKSLPALRKLILDLRVASIGPKSGHPRGR
tara:strand:- start:13980 stop:14375 length:396 start_codon:yes stop_codon:yes gene_type:complete